MDSRGTQGGTHAPTRGPRRNWRTSKQGRTSKEPQRLEELIAKTKQILKEHGKAKAVWFNRRGHFEARTCDGQHKYFAVPDYRDMHLQVLEQDDNEEVWQLLQCRFAECEAAAIAWLDSLSASSSPPGPGAGSEDREGTGGPRSDLEGAEDTDVEPPSEG